MPLFDSLALKRLDRLVLQNRSGSWPWNRRRRAIPSGGEWTGLRDYSPSDDYRAIHWGICARRDDVLTQTFEGEADRRLDILLDCSAGMAPGKPAKFDVARQAAALVAQAALAHGDRVGILADSDGVLVEVPQKRGVAHRAAVVRFLESLSAPSGPPALVSLAERVALRGKRPGDSVVIADLAGLDELAEALDRLRYAGREPYVVLLYSRDDARPRHRGDAQLVPPLAETGEPVLVTERVLARYRERFAEELARFRRVCHQRGLRCVQLAVETDLETMLTSVLRGTAPPTIAAQAGS